MGMSTRIKGFISDDNETYRKHCAVLRACIDARISELPRETAEYFGCDSPEEYLFEEKLETDIKVHRADRDMVNGWEIIVSEIPEGVYKIRFENSY